MNYPSRSNPDRRTLTTMGEHIVTKHLSDIRLANLSPGTVYQRRRCLIRFERLTGVHPLDATGHDVDTWWSAIPGGVEYRACELSHLRQFYKWALRHGHVAEDPTDLIMRPTLARRLPRPIADEDLVDALENAPSRIRPWLYLAAYAGLRACEVAQLRADALHLNADPPLIVIERSKGGGMSSVPLHPRLAEVLRSTDLPATGYLFRRCDGKPGPNRPWVVSQMSNRYLHSRGISSTFHSLRHWFGTNVYRTSGRDIRVAQELLRHTSPVSTAIYTYVDPGESATAVQNLPTVA